MEIRIGFDDPTETAIFVLNARLYKDCVDDKERAKTFAEKNHFAIVWVQTLTLLMEYGLLNADFKKAFCELLGCTFFDDEEQNWLQFDDDGFTEEEDAEN